MKFHKILAPTDFSAGSETGVRAAVELAAQFGATLTIVHAHEIPIFPIGAAAYVPSPEVVAMTASDSQRQLDELAARVASPGVTIETRSLADSASRAIVELARDQSFDLIVISTHGRTGLPRLMLGSVAESVVRAADVPVLTIRAPHKPKQ